MTNHTSHFPHFLLAPALATALWLGAPANAQSPSPRGDSDVTRSELASVDRFMDSHPEIAEQLRKDPSLVKNKEFVAHHPALQEYLQKNPKVREEMTEDPGRFMHQEQRFDRHEDRTDADRKDDANRTDADRNDNDRNTGRRDDADRKDADRKDDKDVARQDQDRDADRRDDRAYDQDRDRDQDRDQDRDRDRDNDRRGGGRADNDVTRRQLENVDRFMDSHPEISEQLRKDPSLVNNKEFVENHPAFREYLQQNPGVREEMTENPNRFMHQEQRFDRQEDGRARYGVDRDADSRQDFGRFLSGHSEVSAQLSKNPSLATNEEYVENHPELKQFLASHPGAQKDLKENPQSFVQAAQQFNNTTPAPKTPNLDPTKTPNLDPTKQK
jgi:hypothetical protein